jgi:hypothetical protein
LKKGLSILLAFAILAQGMISLGLCAYYEINKKTIADKLCVNKSNPKLHCNGKCYLSKQLKKAEENEKRQSKSLMEKDEVITVYDKQIAITFIPSFSFVSLMGYYSGERLSTPRIIPDQPPRVLA